MDDETDDSEEEDEETKMLKGMTQTQKERYLRAKKRKPRPRDFFDVYKIIARRESKALNRMETRLK